MKKIFIDCGTNLCQGLSSISEMNNIDDTWNVYWFEANPHTFKKIDKTKFTHVKFINKAVWTENCMRSLNIEVWPGKIDDYHNRFLINKEESDLLIGGGTNIMSDNFQYPNSQDFYIKESEIVECIDLSEFIKQFDKNDFLIIKLDVEGAEYPILEKMIKEGTIEYVNELYVEWHNHLLRDKYDQNSIIHQILNKNIKLHFWH